MNTASADSARNASRHAIVISGMSPELTGVARTFSGHDQAVDAHPIIDRQPDTGVESSSILRRPIAAALVLLACAGAGAAEWMHAASGPTCDGPMLTGPQATPWLRDMRDQRQAACGAHIKIAAISTQTANRDFGE
jgi:hypothetical protein